MGKIKTEPHSTAAKEQLNIRDQYVSLLIMLSLDKEEFLKFLNKYYRSNEAVQSAQPQKRFGRSVHAYQEITAYLKMQR